MEFRVLGPLEVEEEGQALPLGGAKQRALLATLLVRANRVVSVDALLDELWGEQPPGSAVNMVQGYVSRLRKVFPSDGHDVIVHSPPGYVLRVEPERIDSHRFEHLLRESTEARSDGDLEAAGSRLREALALWRGAALSNVEVNSFVEIELGRLEELRLSAIEERIDIDLALGRHAETVAELEALVAEHPLRERLRRELMLALYRCDRQADALSVYRDGRRHLVEELGIEPGAPLRELERAILDQDPSLRAEAPPSRAEALETSGPGLRRSRGLLVAVGVLVVVGAIAAVAAVVSGGDSTIMVRPNEVGVVDPSTNTVTDALRVGSSPRGIAVGEGAVWVANLDDKTVSHIDPRTHAVRTFATTATPTGIAAGLGAVWVAHWRGTVERIAPRYERPSDTIRALGPSAVLRPITPFSARATVTVGSGAVWAVYFNSTVVRIDPLDDRPRVSGYAGAEPSAIAVSNDAVWVANFGANTVSRLDPNNLKPETSAPITVGKGPSAIAVGGGAVWVADRFSDFVSRIDPLTNTTTTVRVGRRPDALAYGFGSVWVANGGSGTVTRIDPRTSSVIRTIKVGNSPSGIAIGERRVWVTVQRA